MSYLDWWNWMKIRLNLWPSSWTTHFSSLKMYLPVHHNMIESDELRLQPGIQLKKLSLISVRLMIFFFAVFGIILKQRKGQRRSSVLWQVGSICTHKYLYLALWTTAARCSIRIPQAGPNLALRLARRLVSFLAVSNMLGENYWRSCESPDPESTWLVKMTSPSNITSFMSWRVNNTHLNLTAHSWQYGACETADARICSN